MFNSTGAVEDADERAVVVVVGETATYMCRSGETKPFVEEGPLTALLLASFQSSLDGEGGASASLRLIARLRERLREKNIVLIFPLSSSSEYRERLVMFFFERLEVLSVVALSDVVADVIGTGLRESLVLHASLTALCASRVDCCVSAKFEISSAGSLYNLLLAVPTACGEGQDELVGGKKWDADEGAEKEGDEKAENKEEETVFVIRQDGTNGDASSSFCFKLANRILPSQTVVDLSDEAYRERLVSFFGDEVYRRVLSIQKDDNLYTKRRRLDATLEGNVAVSPNQDVVEENKGILRQLITTVAGKTPLPVIVTGEALRVAPLLKEFFEHGIHVWNNKYAAMNDSSSSSDLSLMSSRSFSDVKYSSSRSGGFFRLQSLPLEEFPWMLSMLGGSLVSQLSLTELSKLRISKEDALLSKGSIIHWRSVV